MTVRGGMCVFKCVHTVSVFVYFLLTRLISEGVAPVSSPLCFQYLCMNKEAATRHVLRVRFHLRPRRTPTHTVPTWISNVSRHTWALCFLHMSHSYLAAMIMFVTYVHDKLSAFCHRRVSCTPHAEWYT